MSARLAEAARSCDRIASSSPETFRDALQLFSFWHMALSCVVGGRNITPGRMDQYLFPFYERDVSQGRLTRSDAVELLAATMVRLPQLSGSIATDFQSTKRSPNRYSHYYITLAGSGADGESAVNDLSFAFLEAICLVDYREPSLSIRYCREIDPEFWRRALALMRDRLPVFAYNDQTVVPALQKAGIAEPLAREYVHCGCMNIFIPGHGVPCLRDNHNVPSYLLLALDGGRGTATEEGTGAQEIIRRQQAGSAT